DDAVLVLEWAVSDLDRFADFKADFWFHLFFALFHLREHAVDFRLAHRDRFVLGAGKADHARCIADKIPGAPDELIALVEQMHVHDQITGEKLAGGLAFLALFDFGDALGGDEHLVNEVAHLLGLDPLLDVLLDLVLLSGAHVNNAPSIVACESLCYTISAAG